MPRALGSSACMSSPRFPRCRCWPPCAPTPAPVASESISTVPYSKTPSCSGDACGRVLTKYSHSVTGRPPVHGGARLTMTVADLREGNLPATGGLSLYWRAWLPGAEPRGVVALAHGGLEHGGRYAHVAARFADAGLATYAIDFRGHGRSAGRRGQIGRMSLLVDDLDRLLSLCGRQHPNTPIFAVAHSLGAMVALDYVTSHRSCDLAGLVLSGTGIDVSAITKSQAVIARALSAVTPNLGLVRLDSGLVSRDPAGAQFSDR